MVIKHIREQVELLLEHMTHEELDAEFIQRHAQAIAQLADMIEDEPLVMNKPSSQIECLESV